MCLKIGLRQCGRLPVSYKEHAVSLKANSPGIMVVVDRFDHRSVTNPFISCAAVRPLASHLHCGLTVSVTTVVILRQGWARGIVFDYARHRLPSLLRNTSKIFVALTQAQSAFCPTLRTHPRRSRTVHRTRLHDLRSIRGIDRTRCIMATILSDQAFYALTLEQSTQPTAATSCQIAHSARSQQQIVEAIGQRIVIRELNRSGNNATLSTLIDENVFGIVRGVVAMRIPATDQEKKGFDRTFMETFGKSGIRRSVPGEYLAADPRGRCFMLASVEKNKVVYLAQRMPGGDLTISSPKEANQFGSICYSICALHTDWDNPCFAALEVDYAKLDQDRMQGHWRETSDQPKQTNMLTYYTVEINLASVVKSWSIPVEASATKLFAVPGSEQGGPSGVLVCCAGMIHWYHEKFTPMSIKIPTRDGPNTNQYAKHEIVAGCSHAIKGRNFFFLLQTELGDTWRLTMDLGEDDRGRSTGQVEKLIMRYYETFPVARSMVLLKTGYLYIAAENGSSQLYHVDSLGDEEGYESENTFVEDMEGALDTDRVQFKVRHELSYTRKVDSVPALHPLIKTRVDNLTGEDAPQIYAIQGIDEQSSFKAIRHGLEINPIVNNPIGPKPFDGLWSLKAHVSDTVHTYLILSSSWGELTTVLRIADDVESVEDTGFLNARCTVFAQLMGEDTLVQVHPRAVRQIKSSGQIDEWPSPANRSISVAAGNESQLLLGLSSGELVFFFYGADNSLSQMEDMPEMNSKITAVAVAKLSKGMAQAKYAAVGCDDQTIRIFNITVDRPLEQRSVQALSAVPVSIEIQEIGDDSGTGTLQVVHIGLSSGLYLRAVIDEITGELGDVRTKFLGPRPTRLFCLEVNKQNCLLAASTRPWLGYNHPQKSVYTMTPLITSQLDTAVTFMSEDIKGICAVEEGTKVRGRLSTNTTRLSYTPRAFDRNPWYPIFYIAQGSANRPTIDERKQRLIEKVPDTQTNGKELDSDLNTLDGPGLPRWEDHWASCVTAVDAVGDAGRLHSVPFSSREAALSCVCVAFESRDWEVYLAVGTGMNMRPGKASEAAASGFVHVFRLTNEGSTMEWLHKALLSYKGRLAIGLGNELFIYDIGMKALLRKSRATVTQNQIVSLDAMGDRIVCGDATDGVTYVVFKQQHNRLIPFVDDTIQRWTTTATMIDYETTAGGDKFGNLWVVRPPKQASEESDENGIGGYIVNERSYLGGAPYRLDLKAHYYCQDIPMSIQRTALVTGGQEVLFWAGLQGTMGMLVPFIVREDLDFFTALESQLRQEASPIIGRDHMAFRSYYVPIKGVIDGDLCEKFLTLDYGLKEKIAAELDRSVKDVEKKVGEMRTRVAF
nr:pre-mrna-splicing factor rse1 [Quercus suber]